MLDYADGRRPVDVTVHRLPEVASPPAAAELAIGEDVDARIALELQDVEDCRILHLAQGIGREPAFDERGVRLAQSLRPQKAADLVGSIGCSHSFYLNGYFEHRHGVARSRGPALW